MLEINLLASKVTDIAEDLDITGKIFPSWPTLVATILALIILILTIKFLFYKPIKKIIKDRQDYIQNNINSSKEHLEVAKNKKIEMEYELKMAYKNSITIIDEANQNAENIRNKAIKNAKLESSNLIKQEKLNFQKEKDDFMQKTQVMIADLALEAAKKIIEKEVDDEASHKIINDFIKGK